MHGPGPGTSDPLLVKLFCQSDLGEERPLSEVEEFQPVWKVPGDPFQGLSDLHLGYQKVTGKNLVDNSPSSTNLCNGVFFFRNKI